MRRGGSSSWCATRMARTWRSAGSTRLLPQPSPERSRPRGNQVHRNVQRVTQTMSTPGTATGGEQAPAAFHGLLRRVVDIRPEEVRVVGWCWSYIFSVLASYYIIRSIRDQMGVAGGVENLQWLFTA